MIPRDPIYTQDQQQQQRWRHTQSQIARAHEINISLWSRRRRGGLVCDKWDAPKNMFSHYIINKQTIYKKKERKL